MTKQTWMRRSVRSWAVEVFGLLALGTVAIAQTPAAPSAAEKALIAAEDALFAADVHRDVAVIQRGFADEAVFVHANGDVETKADYLGKVKDHNFQSMVGENRVVKVFGKVGVIRGTKTLVLGDGSRKSGSYLTVYIMRDGRWQMLDEQSAPSPKSAEAPHQDDKK